MHADELNILFIIYVLIELYLCKTSYENKS